MSRHIIKVYKVGNCRRIGFPNSFVQKYKLAEEDYVIVEDIFPDMIVIRKLPGVLDNIKKRGETDGED